MAKLNNIGTFILTDTKIVIRKSDGVTRLAMKLTAGAGTFTGSQNIPIFGGNSAAIPFLLNESVIIDSKEPLDNITIDLSVGTGNSVYVIATAK